MPRIPPSLFWRAHREVSPMAAQLLPACRDLESAANELRWIREHVQDTPSPVAPGLRVWDLVTKRSKGVPLQYVLGTQPFGPLEIKCRPGVLIPRPETEAYTLHIAKLLSQDQPLPGSLTILDLCTGTGCIPLLLLHTLLSTLPTTDLTIHGLDISPHAIALARTNHLHNPPLPIQDQNKSHTLNFTLADIFSPLPTSTIPPKGKEIDLLISNPPYISQSDYSTTTARAVRNHEPRLALVPSLSLSTVAQKYGCQPEDVFYARLLELAAELRPKRVVLEVGGMEQALRVVGLVHQHQMFGDGEGEYGMVEVWRDEPGVVGDKGKRVEVGGREVVVRGAGRGRVVYLCRDG